VGDCPGGTAAGCLERGLALGQATDTAARAAPYLRVGCEAGHLPACEVDQARAWAAGLPE
jgi:hypothetical protein